MPRQVRIEYADAIYHVMSRGNGGKNIFLNDVDRQDFLKTLAETCVKTGFQVHAYCLMRNHFHMVVETPHANLVGGMRWFLSSYTLRFNPRHRRFGHVFSGRYKSLVVDGSGDGYLRTVCDYVHLNPVRAKLLPAQGLLKDFRWSSYGDYLNPPGGRPAWLRVDRLLGEKGISKDSLAGRKEFERQMEGRRWEELGPEFKPVERGWCLGSEQFRAELVAAAGERVGRSHYGAERQEADEARTERLVRAGLQKLGWTERELRERRKGDKAKVKLARQLRGETTMTLSWIARRLHMGSWTYVSNLLREKK